MSADLMSQTKARAILRRIIPWALEAASAKQHHRTNYKGARGRVGIVGGARDYSGAPYFASIASMRLGADLAYVVCSSTASQAIKSYSPDLIVTPLLDCETELEFDTEIDCLLTRLHTLVIGPGLGRDKLVQDRAKKLIALARTRSIPIVLDADSLLMVTQDPSIIKSYPKALLTPNRIELQRLLNSMYAPDSYDLRNMPTQQIQDLVKKCSFDLQVPVLSKGMVDLICDPSGFQLNTDPLSGSNRRCGGQGDILSGLAGAYLHWIEQANREQNAVQIDNPVAWAAYLASITTRRCNELAYKDFKNGMLASNMIDKISKALDSLLDTEDGTLGSCPPPPKPIKNAAYSGMLTNDEINRYTRQMIMDEFGPERQMNLKKASAIIIGAGGLGCPSSVYLAAGGIGRLGIVDDDRVETSNLHRQILHNLPKVGMLKTDSIKEAILAINPNVVVDTHSVRLTRENAVQLIEDYDMVIDATDNLLTRYMINDACVVARKPLISGAALKMDGQLTVYNFDAKSPCFRCLFPVPPPPNAVGSCSDNGVLGVIPGIVGVHQALEALKIGAGLRPAYAGKMLLFDGQLGLFRQITLCDRKPDCAACGQDSKLTRDLIDYEKFCGQMTCQPGKKGADMLNPNERVTIEQYREIIESGQPHVLVDVRPLSHSDVSRFAHALAIPVAKLVGDPDGSLKRIEAELESCNTNQIYVVCRRGIASQRGTRAIQDLFKDRSTEIVVKDIIGGMTAWAKEIDPSYACV